MELRQLSYFVTVAEELHFGRAAARLHIVQSAVSQQIRRLERELGAELFDRSPRHVRLTGAGERLLPEARAVLVAADRARAAVAPVAALRLGTSTGLGEHLDRVLAAFAEREPGVQVELVALPAEERLARVADGRLDAAFVRGAAPREHPPGVRVLPLWPDPLVAALPAGHPLAARDEVALDELAGLPLSITARRINPALVDLVVGACHDAGFEPLPGPTSGSLQDTLATIGARPLWTVVYASHARVLHTPRVAYVPFRAPGLALGTGLAVHGSEPTPYLDGLLAACGDHEN
ncbi:LysR substrate-binding domain-containing protein [Streptomyces sp. NPDC050564]|uniref:LysR substrate-binding domain-containing protein n=1 Tax=Streptomyces sp. NPDC050564 TaxID=3365631 RepID=UPI00378A5439